MNEFNSQVCTSTEQSKRLLAMGLKPETADMHHYQYTEGGRWNVEARPSTAGYNNRLVPAWSLHRLIELLPQHIHLDDYEDTHYWLVIDPLKVIYKNSYSSWIYQCDEGGLYDKLINTIEWTIKNNHFNKEYLKQ